MPTFEITVPAPNQGDVQMKLTVDAGNWLDAIRLGLEELGQDDLPPEARCRVQPDGSMRVDDEEGERTWFVRRLGGEPGPETSLSDTWRGRTPPGLLEPRPANPFRSTRPSAGRYPAVAGEARTQPRFAVQPVNVPVSGGTSRNSTPDVTPRPSTTPFGSVASRAAVKAGPATAQPPDAPEPTEAPDRTEVDMPGLSPDALAALEAAAPPATPDPQTTATQRVTALEPPIARLASGTGAPPEEVDAGRLRRLQNARTAVFPVLDPSSAPPVPATTRGRSTTDVDDVVARALVALERPNLTAEQVIDAALDLARDHIACGGIQLLLPTARLDRFKVVAALGDSASELARAGLRLERRISELVVDREGATRLTDLEATLTYERGGGRRPTELFVGSLLWVPIRHRARLLAVLAIVNARGPVGFTEREARAADALASTLSRSLAKHL